MRALAIHAGPRAREHLRRHGLRPQDVRVIPAAAGGPKGLLLNPLDCVLFGRWLADSTHTVHLAGASIGAWRMACATMDDPARALQRLADDYIAQRYDPRDGAGPLAAQMSAVFGARLDDHFRGREAQVLNHRRYRLHVFASRGRGLLAREGRLRTPAGYVGALVTNLVSRRAMGHWLERVVFSDPREPLPFRLDDYRTRLAPLTSRNLSPAVLASCSIPFIVAAVHDIPDAPQGPYWDGGITDYHLHLDYASMGEGLVLYPHFQQQVIPGWLDKSLPHRHRASEHLSNVVVLSPEPEWVRTLPNGKLPDRSDFKAYGADHAGRAKSWHTALAMAQQLADEFEALVAQPSIEARPLR